jgi:2-dehydro-3-deoxyphosphogluconate aldolase/(4S)-4-hydroxy-2-oxoglutarate aldolase
MSALARIRDVGVVPVIRADSSDRALRIADALVEGGMTILEVTMTVPGATGVMKAISQRIGQDLVLGAGTVTSEEMVDEAVDAGCTFVVTPCVVPEVIAAAKGHGIGVIGGALSPTEVFATHRAGADMIKVFPASTAGGPGYIRALKGPFPSIELMATGGIALDAVEAYFHAGVAAIGAGSEMISKTAVAFGDFAAIRDAAKAFVGAARRARAASEGVRR